MPVFRTLVTPCDVIRDKSGIKKRDSGPVFCALSDEHKKWVGQIFSPEKLFNFIQGLGNKKVGKIHDNIQLKRQNNNQKWKQITLFLHLTLAEKVAY